MMMLLKEIQSTSQETVTLVRLIMQAIIAMIFLLVWVNNDTKKHIDILFFYVCGFFNLGILPIAPSEFKRLPFNSLCMVFVIAQFIFAHYFNPGSVHATILQVVSLSVFAGY